MKKSLNIKQIGKTTGVLLAGIILGWLLFGGSPANQPSSMDEHVQEAHTDAQGNIVYTCSMHPNVRESEPGNCPICGMELIPVNKGTSSEEENPYEFAMTKAAMKLAEVQTTKANKSAATNIIHMPGKVMVDERRLRSLPAHFPGRIEQLYVNFTGEYIEKHEKVAAIYSPALISAQKELLEAARHKEPNRALYKAARTKLLNWKIPENQVNEIEESGEVKTQFDITSHMGGYVIKRNIAVGDHVEMGTVMYQMADLSNVWVTFNAYESDLAGINEGDQVSFTVDSYPGETFQAEVTYIDPFLNPESRTAKVRAEASNPNGKLKPQMLAEGVISSKVSGGQEVLQVPKSAVLWTGERSVVYVKKPNTERPIFEFREIVLGQRVGEYYIVKSGLKPGEDVVTNGNFKIDSAAQLAGKASMMNREPNGRVPSGHNHGSMNMESSSAQTETKTTNMITIESADTTHSHDQHLSILVEKYIKIKNALVNDHLDEAKTYFLEFKSEVTASSEMNNHNAHSEKHKLHHNNMVQALKSASASNNMEEFRSAFSKISENLIKAIENQGYDKEELHIQFCPMASSGKGAYWISDQEKITNPYMGKEMPMCGENKETLHF